MKPEKKDRMCENLYIFFGVVKPTGRHLRRHCRMPPRIPMAVSGVQLPQGYRATIRGGSLLSTSSFQKFLVLIWSTSEGWKAEWISEPSSGFERKTLGLGIQRVNKLLNQHAKRSVTSTNSIIMRPWEADFVFTVKYKKNFSDAFCLPRNTKRKPF